MHERGEKRKCTCENLAFEVHHTRNKYANVLCGHVDIILTEGEFTDSNIVQMCTYGYAIIAEVLVAIQTVCPECADTDAVCIVTMKTL